MLVESTEGIVGEYSGCDSLAELIEFKDELVLVVVMVTTGGEGDDGNSEEEDAFLVDVAVGVEFFLSALSVDGLLSTTSLPPTTLLK